MKSKLGNINNKACKLIFFVAASLLIFANFMACGGRGDTDNSNDPNAGSGTPFVSDGSAGSSFRVELEGNGNEIGVTSKRNFKVTAVDPQGAPLSNIRIFCESEKGIAILEPSSGGVAFAHTNQNGIMSGVLGGLLPGSYLLECRGPQGFNLVGRINIKVSGDVPEGFVGFPGAAGGNLGGGAVVPPSDNNDFAIVQVRFTTVTSNSPSRVGDIDLSRGLCKDGAPYSGSADDEDVTPEPFGPDNFELSIINTLEERITIKSVTMEVPTGSGGTVLSEQQLGGLLVQGGATLERNFVGPFTDTSGGSKTFASTNVPVPAGVHNIKFTIALETITGVASTVDTFATVRAFNVNACGG